MGTNAAININDIINKMNSTRRNAEKCIEAANASAARVKAFKLQPINLPNVNIPEIPDMSKAKEDIMAALQRDLEKMKAQ